MASTYYVKKNGKFPRALFAEHTGKANFVFHMPDGVMAVKESHSCLRSIQAGNWKVITKEEAFALKEKKVTQSFPKYYAHRDRITFGGGGILVRRITPNELEFVRPDGTTYDKRMWDFEEKWVASGAWYEISKEEADKLVPPKEPAAPEFKPSGAGVYLTAGGYLVKLNKELVASKEYSPGLNNLGSTSLYGWGWTPKGTIIGLQPEWCEKLCLIEKMPDGFVIPPETDEFVYADGYPMVRAPKKGEYYIQLNGLKEGQKYQPLLASCPDRMYDLPIHQSVIFLRRTKEMLPKYYIRHNNLEFVNNIAFVERSTDNKRINHYFDGTTKVSEVSWASDIQSYVDDGRWVEISLEQGKQLIAQKNDPVPCPITADGQYELMNGQIVNLKLTPYKYLAWGCDTDQVKASDGTIASWIWRANGTIDGLGDKEYCKALYVKRFIGPLKESVTTVGTENQKVTTGEEEMKKETAVVVAKTVGNLALRAVNYWAWEPAKNMGVRVLSSIRYVTFFAGITACILGYNYPTQTKALVKSALPKIHFSVERPDLLK